MSTFEQYDTEFASLLQQIEASLGSEPPSQYTENLLQQSSDLIKQMAVEARSNPDATQKRAFLDKVRSAKSQHAALQSQYDKLSLTSGAGGGNRNKSQQERLLLKQNEDMLAGQNETLERARRTMQETEQVALEITEELGSNREKLMSTHGRVREVSGLAGRARRILVSMNQRAVQQKMIVYGVAVGLVLAFFILMWSLWH